MLTASTYFLNCSSCAKHSDSGSVSLTRVMWKYKGNMNSASKENSKESSSSTISTEASFNVDSNEETINLNKTCCQQ